MTRNLTRGALAIAAGAILLSALSAGPLLADLGGVSPDSWARFFKYAGCAIAIAGASTGWGIAGAIAMCAHVFVTEG